LTLSNSLLSIRGGKKMKEGEGRKKREREGGKRAENTNTLWRQKKKKNSGGWVTLAYSRAGKEKGVEKKRKKGGKK